MSDPLPLPADLQACQTLLGALARQLAAKDQQLVENEKQLAKNELLIAAKDLQLQGSEQQIAEMNRQIAELKLEINELLQAAFRKRSERYIEDPGQLRLDFGNTDEAADAAAGLAEAIEDSGIVVAEHRRIKRALKVRNEQLPPHLPRYEVELAAPEASKTCPQHGLRKLIGHDRIETLEFERPKLRVRVTLVPKLACESAPECSVAQPPRPAGLVEGNRYDTTVAAEIITAKYGYHLPIYRQQDWFGGSGWTPSRSTLLNILAAAATLVAPLAAHFRKLVIADGLLGTDDTRVTLLLPPDIPPVGNDRKSQRIHEVFTEAIDSGKPSVSARMWAYRSLLSPLTVFDFTVSRHRDGPQSVLLEGGFTGTMMADCYAGYQGIAIASNAAITRAACVAHARRKIFDARASYPLLANQFLVLFQQLYDIEDRGKPLSPAERHVLRQAEALPVWLRIRELMDGEGAARLLPKDKLNEALNYMRNQWGALLVYLDDGRLPIDNNDVEQLMKQVAIGRKNWLFIGSIAAGERAADLMTLVSSAVRNDLDVWAYLRDVLDKLLAGSTDYHSLRPDVWAQAHPDAIRVYRQQERRHRADAKNARRSRRRR